MSFEESFFGPGNRLVWEEIRARTINPRSLEALEPFLARLSTGSDPLILPRVRTDTGLSEWYVLCSSAQSYRIARDELDSLLGTTYADLNAAASELSEEDAIDAAVMQRHGSYAFKVPVINQRLAVPIRERLLLYLRLCAERPPRQGPRHRAPGRMLRDFEYALLSGDEPAAEQGLDALRSAGHLDASNLLFLEVRRLAAFGHWAAILMMPEVIPLLSMRRPRRVTEALVQAIYAVHLAGFEHERQAASAVAVFRSQVLPTFGSLFETRAGLQSNEADVSFALKAAALDPPQRTLVDAILAEHPATDPMHAYLASIAHLVPPGASRLADAQTAFNAGDIDHAFDLSLQNATTVESCVITLRCAREMETISAATTAMIALRSLPEADRNKITQHPVLGRIVKYLGELSETETGDPASVAVASWSGWLHRLQAQQPWPLAVRVAQSGSTEWSAEAIVADAIEVDRTAALILADRPAWAQEAFFDGLPHMLQTFSSHSGDSRLRPILDNLFIAISLDDHVSGPRVVALLRLADLRLGLGVTIAEYRDLVGQLGAAIDTLESASAADFALDGLELLVTTPCPDPGERLNFFQRTSAVFSRWYRRIDSSQWRLLQRLSEEIGAGATPPIPEPTATTTSDISPWMALAGQTVAFYSLRESALRHAVNVMADVAPDTRVVTFSDEVGGSPALRTAAATAHIFVLATEVATHAAVGFIRMHRPTHLATVYARGQGSTGLLAAVRTQLRTPKTLS